MTFRTLRRTFTWAALAATPAALAAACDKSDPPARTAAPAAGDAGSNAAAKPADNAPTAQSLAGQSALGSAVRSGEKLKSATVMREILMAQILAKNETGRWPPKLPEGVSHANPWTDSDPGYEWVPPANNVQGDAKTVVLYQLKDGKRVTGAPTGRADGSVREPNE